MKREPDFFPLTYVMNPGRMITDPCGKKAPPAAIKSWKEGICLTTGNRRLQSVDAMKALAILTVVFYHLMAPCAVHTVLRHIIDPMLILFFFCSGYFHKPGRRTPGENIRIRLKTTMVPFIKYSLLFWFIGSVWMVTAGTETVMEALWCLRNFFGGCIWNRVIQNWFGWEYHSLGKRYFFLADFWFLPAMLFAGILFFLIADKVLSSRKKTTLCAAACLAVTGILLAFHIDLPYNIHLVPFWAAFILLGAFAGQKKLFGHPPLSGAKGWGLSLLLLAAGITLAMFKPEVPNLFRGHFPEDEVVSMLLTTAASLLIICGLGMVCRLAEIKGFRMKELAWLGSHSLTVYLWHMFFAWIICMITGTSIGYPDNADAGLVFRSVLLSFGCLVLSVLCAVVTDKIKARRS